jgi:hypothetical protein
VNEAIAGCLPGHSVRRAALSAWPGNGTSRPPTGCRHGLRRRFCYGVVQHGRSTAPKPETGRVQLTQRRRAAPSRALKVLFASKAHGRARPPSGITRPRGFAPNELRRAPSLVMVALSPPCHLRPHRASYPGPVATVAPGAPAPGAAHEAVAPRVTHVRHLIIDRGTLRH